MNEIVISFYQWIRLFFHVGAYPDFALLLKYFIWFAIWLSSGFLAATISEMKGYGVLLHFGGGLLLPYIYPIAIIFLLQERFGEKAVGATLDESETRVAIASYEITERIKQHRIQKRLDKLGIDPDSEEAQAVIEEENQLFKAHEVEIKPKEEVLKEIQSEDEEEQTVSEEDGMNRSYFEAIAVNALGEREGPFDLELNNGTVMAVESIANILDDLAVFEIIDHNGRKKRLRVKYENIVSCRKRQL